MLLTHLFENKHMTEADIASVNWNTDSRQHKLNEFAPGAGGDDEAGDDPYKYPKPKRYNRSADYFEQFEADHFDREDFDDDTGVFKGYWGNTQIAYFKFDNPARTGGNNPGMGWYYEPESSGRSDDTAAAPAADDSAERKQQELSMINAFLKSGNRPNPDSQIGRLMKKHGMTEGAEQQLSVQQLAAISDEALDKAYGYGRSTPGNTFGWQANLKSAQYAKQMIDKGVTDIEAISDAIHKGWNVTAQAFVQNPEQFDDTAKLQAAGKLEAKLQQRAQLMKQNYAQLPDEEKEKDRVVARALLQAIRGQQGVAEASNELATMTTMGMGDPLDFSSDYALYTVQKGRELFSTMRKLYSRADALPPAERSRFYQRLDALAYEGLGDEILRYSKTLTVDDLVAITDVLENYDIMFNTIAIPDELQDAEAAWKQYAAEVALARTQPQPGQTMHERNMAEDSENAFAPLKLHDEKSNAYGDAILDIADQFEDKFSGEEAGQYATAIATVGHAFLNNGMRLGRAKLFGLEQAVYKHVLMALDQQGHDIVKDLIRPHFKPDNRVPFKNMAEGDISQLEKDVADAPVEPIANMEAKEKVGNMDADAFDAAMARLKKLAGAGPLKTVWDPAKRVYKNVPSAVQPKK